MAVEATNMTTEWHKDHNHTQRPVTAECAMTPPSTRTLPTRVTPLYTPTPERGVRKRRGTWNEGTPLSYDGEEEEKREDADSIHRGETMTRMSPRSPIAVLKLRRTNLFREDEGTPTKPITVTYSPSERGQISSQSIASSMFLVSPLRPLARQRAVAPSHPRTTSDLRTALIDSSQTLLRPLTPRGPAKRSLSEAMCLDGREEETKEPDEDFLRLATPHSQPQTTITPNAQQQQQSSKPRLLIPAEHPYKILWDVLTFVLSFANVYATHMSIRDRQFGNSWFMTFCEAWFMVDILLNFITEYRSDSYALRDCRSVWARYLTTWFVVDVLSLFPGEALYLQPLIEQQNRRGFFKKNFFRTKAVVRVTRILRGRHFKMFGKAAKHGKHVGVGASRLLRLLIKYIPKYLLFFRNMKGVLALRMLRQVHWFRKVWRNFRGLDNIEGQPLEAPLSLQRKLHPDDYDEDDDGAPF